MSREALRDRLVVAPVISIYSFNSFPEIQVVLASASVQRLNAGLYLHGSYVGRSGPTRNDSKNIVLHRVVPH